MCLQHDPIAVKGNQSQSHVRACTWPTTLMGARGDRCDSRGEIKTRLLTWVTRLGGGRRKPKRKKKEGNKTVSTKGTAPQQDIHAGI